jgi:tRNA pseudouridine55 synthase
MADLPELLLVDKPKGITSFDVIRQLRKQTGIRKFGHAGTLDPLASGLMLIGVERGTKRLSELIKLDKEYIAEVRLGESRTTGDLEGEVVDETKITPELQQQLQSRLHSALQTLVGEQVLPVSAYSAIKVDGVPMYKRARKAEVTGEAVLDIPVRTMMVHEVELLGTEQQTDRLAVGVRFKVGSGTYIRSLAEELGRRLGLPACLADLRRTQVGEYRIEEALKLADIK